MQKDANMVLGIVIISQKGLEMLPIQENSYDSNSKNLIKTHTWDKKSYHVSQYENKFESRYYWSDNRLDSWRWTKI